MSKVAEMVAVAQLKPWVKNPRKNDHAVRSVADSITRFGFANPILARAEDGRVIAGHTRLKAAILLGLTEVPVRYLDLTNEQADALALADNKLGELATWDDAALAEVLAGLDSAAKGLGWTDDELADLLRATQPEPVGDPDDAPEVQADAVSVAGEVYELGPHRLVCGDSTTEGAWAALMLPGERLQMVWTDPPYGMALDVRYGAMHPARRKSSSTYTPIVGDDAPFDASPFIARVRDVPEQFWWGADYYREHLPNGGSWVVWDKRYSEDMNLDEVVGGHFELCWSKVKHRREIARILWSGHHGMAREDTKSRVHPTQKPTALACWFFDRWGAAGDLVVDLFGGSGTTLIACAMRQRVARVIELDPRYCDVIRRRWTKWARDNGQDPGQGALE